MHVIRSFGSDNHSGVAAEVLTTLSAININHVPAYGDDFFTKQALELFRQHFGSDIQVFFVFNGTGANVISLKSALQSYEAVLCANSSHINEHECGAPEQLIGCKLITIDTPDGKLTPELIKAKLIGINDEHCVQPKVISITQITEHGTAYSLTEIQALSNFAKQHQLYLHMDGARFSNAICHLNCTFKAMTVDVGIDILSFGGTKNGLMCAEAIVVFNPILYKALHFYRKQYMQLSSKMRFLAGQFIAYFENDLWRKNAEHANQMTKYLVKQLMTIDIAKLRFKVEGNMVFVRLAFEYINKLKKHYLFYTLEHELDVIRLVCSFDTSETDINNFITTLKQISIMTTV